MKEILLTIQITVSIILIGIILIQSKGGGLGSAFGGSSQIYRSKRGVEKLFVYLTIILAVLFFALSIVQLLID